MRDHFDPSSYQAGPLMMKSSVPSPRHHNTNSWSRSSSPMRTRPSGSSSIVVAQVSPRSSAINTLPLCKEISGLKRRACVLVDKQTMERQSYNNNNDNSDKSNPLDCQSLQLSLKRVKLSCSPGELRLQRDLKMLPPHEWQEEQLLFQNHNDSCNSTWIHRRTRARLTLLDSLRLYLFLPTQQEIGASSSHTSSLQQQHHQQQLHHSKFHWRMMIQIPRMFPHRPPVVSRLEGNLWVHQVVINEAPPVRSSPSVHTQYPLLSLPQVEDVAKQEHYPPDMLLVHEKVQQLSLQSANASQATTTTESLDGSLSYHICGGGKTVVWSKWSPILSLGDLLEFLLEMAETTTTAAVDANQPQPFTKKPTGLRRDTRVVSADERGLLPAAATTALASTVSSSSYSFPSLTDVQPKFSFRSRTYEKDDRLVSTPYFLEEHKWKDATMMRMMNDDTSVIKEKEESDVAAEPAQSFLKPNRFDQGYEKNCHFDNPWRVLPSSTTYRSRQSLVVTNPPYMDYEDEMMDML